MDETEIDQIAINTLTPLVARLLGWASGVLTGVGVTVNFGPDSSLKIATIAIGLIGMVAHQIIAARSQKSNAKSAFSQGQISAVTSTKIYDAVVNNIAAPKPPLSNPTTKPLQDLADK